VITAFESCFHHRNVLAPILWVERYQNATIRYGKQSFGIYWEVFRDLEIKEDFLKPYKHSEAEKLAARDDKFIEKDVFNLIDSSKKIVDDFKMLRPKMTVFVLQSITPAGEEKIKERYRPEWTNAINEDDIIGMVKLIITCHTSTGKASEFTDKFIAVEDYRNFTYKEGTTIAEYANQLYNILSLHQAQVHGFCELTSQDQQCKILSNPERGIALVFHKDDTDKFYKLHTSEVVEYFRKVYSIGLQNVYCESRVYNAVHFYTLDQQQRAQEAIRLHQALNHPSDKALLTLLVSPSAINIKVTPMDLQNARAIYGSCPHCLEGKPQLSKGSHKSFDDSLKPTEPGEMLHCDIVFIKGKPRLFSVDHVSGYMMLVAMDSKKTEELVRALDATITKYRSHHKFVYIVSTDHESVLKSKQLALHLNGKGVKVALRIPYEHKKTAEREKMEAKISVLPYNLPSDLYDSDSEKV
jgi:hypothetical protein